jgi:hypothetical protein
MTNTPAAESRDNAKQAAKGSMQSGRFKNLHIGANTCPVKPQQPSRQLSQIIPRRSGRKLARPA